MLSGNQLPNRKAEIQAFWSLSQQPLTEKFLMINQMFEQFDFSFTKCAELS